MTLFADPLYATLLLLVVTNSRVLLAADSRKNTLYADGSSQPGTTDKIFRTGDCHYAASGFSTTADGHFSLQAIVHRELLQHADFDRAVKQVARALAGELQHYLTGLRQCSPALFAHLQRHSHSGGEVVLVTRVQSVATAVLLTYRISHAAAVRVVLDSWRIDTTQVRGPNDCYWRAIGHTDFLQGCLPRPEDMAARPVQQIRQLMQQGARAHPQHIGGTVAILELSPAGEQWIQKSATTPVCL